MLTPPNQPPQRITKVHLDTIKDTLNTCDHQLLTLLETQHFATTNQVAIFFDHHYASHEIAQRQAARQTKRLHQLGLIDHLERRIGGTRKGSASLIWYLTEPELRLITGKPKRLRHKHPSLTFINRMLTIAEIRVQLEKHTITNPNITTTKYETEPHCWRTYLDHHNLTQTIKPDLAIIIETNTYEDHYWCEADLATENPARIHTKIQRYLDHYNTGQEQQTRGIYPHIIFITTTPERTNQLQHIINTHPELPPRMITTCTIDHITTHLHHNQHQDQK